MANMIQQLIIHADPNQPVEEIRNIIVGFLRMHPGKEVEILYAVKKDIEEALPQFIKDQEATA